MNICFWLIASISCTNIGGKSYIVADIKYECNTDEFFIWTFLLVLPLLILTSIIFPAILYNKLSKDNAEYFTYKRCL